MEIKQEMELVRKYFTKGYRIGEYIPATEFDLLQKQFELKSLDRSSKNYNQFRALSLGLDTALTDRGLLNKKSSKKRSALKELIKGVSKQNEQDQNLDIDF